MGNQPSNGQQFVAKNRAFLLALRYVGQGIYRFLTLPFWNGVNAIVAVVLTLVVTRIVLNQDQANLFAGTPRYQVQKDGSWQVVIAVSNNGPTTASDLTATVDIVVSNEITPTRLSILQTENTNVSVNPIQFTKTSQTKKIFWGTLGRVPVGQDIITERYDANVDRLYNGETILITADFDTGPSKTDQIISEWNEPKYFSPAGRYSVMVPVINGQDSNSANLSGRFMLLRKYFVNNMGLVGNKVTLSMADSWQNAAGSSISK